jgi:hypothetical protein
MKIIVDGKTLSYSSAKFDRALNRLSLICAARKLTITFTNSSYDPDIFGLPLRLDPVVMEAHTRETVNIDTGKISQYKIPRQITGWKVLCPEGGIFRAGLVQDAPLLAGEIPAGDLPEDTKALLRASTEATDRLHKSPDGTPKMTQFSLRCEAETKALVAWTHPEHGQRKVTIRGRQPIQFIKFLLERPDFTGTTRELDRSIKNKTLETRSRSYSYKDMFIRRVDGCLFWREIIYNPPRSQRYSLKILR